MRNIWLIIAFLGYAVTLIPMLQYSIDTGNYLFWFDPAATSSLVFSNIGITAFSVDLFFTVFVVLTLITMDARKKSIPNVWRYWVMALLFGMAGTLPLYIHVRQKYVGRKG